MLIIDSREQKPLYKRGTKNTIFQKLDVGDYTTLDLLGKFHVERKSPGDLYGSIIQGHERFRRELMRAKASNVELVIMVECVEHVFTHKCWSKHAMNLQVSSKTLQKIVDTIQEKYGVRIIWCSGRRDMKKQMKQLFIEKNGEVTRN